MPLTELHSSLGVFMLATSLTRTKRACAGDRSVQRSSRILSEEDSTQLRDRQLSLLSAEKLRALLYCVSELTKFRGFDKISTLFVAAMGPNLLACAPPFAFAVRDQLLAQ